MTKRHLAILLTVFLLTRVFNLWYAQQPRNLGAGAGDLYKYQLWGFQLEVEHLNPYSEMDVEYPPGVIPFLQAAEVVKVGDLDHTHRFIYLMALLELFAFAGLLLLAQRWGSSIGPWAWIVGTLALGPIYYLRLDLIPATATIWALERAAAGGWWGSGGWLAFGAIAKVYPGFLLPPAIAVTKQRLRIVGGALVVGAVLLLPYVGSIAEMVRDVLGYHGERGLQVESTWSSLILAASRFGYPASVNFGFGSNELTATAAPTLKNIGTAASVAAWIGATWIIAMSVRRGDVRRLAVGTFGLLALLLGFGTVFSPQFVIWLIALAAAALCAPQPRRLLIALALTGVVAAVTQFVYPFTLGDVLAPFYAGESAAGSPLGLTFLLVRNLLVLAVGGTALWELWADRKAAGPRVSGGLRPTDGEQPV